MGSFLSEEPMRQIALLLIAALPLALGCNDTETAAGNGPASESVREANQAIVTARGDAIRLLEQATFGPTPDARVPRRERST